MRDEVTYLEDILEAIDAIDRYIKGMDFESFRKDDKTISAVVRKLEIIGEASKKITEETKSAYPDTPWRAAAGMRDRLIHAYYDVEEEIVWDTVQKSLPAFKKTIQTILGN